MNKLTRLLAGLTIALLALTPLASAQTASLTILHTNDTHGHLLPFSYPTIVPRGSELEGLAVRQNIGGIANFTAIPAGASPEQVIASLQADSTLERATDKARLLIAKGAIEFVEPGKDSA